ncbi:MAG: hypothetical protein HYY36_03465 [Gammaproteobacteria bacterium]|nr:hypothetical protein [Gammaproteobacteria bacterium]
MKRTLIRASILALAVGVAGGCATTEQINEIKSMAQSAQSTANAAQQRADNALSVANQALDAARSAQSAADAAMACCNDNKSRLDRMFEKAMQK